MKNIFLIITAFTIGLAGCVSPRSEIKKTVPLNTVHEGSIAIGKRTIPLPDGLWKVIGRGCTGKNDSFNEIFLLKLNERKQFEGAILIYVDTSTNSFQGYLPDKMCNRKDIYHVEVINNKRGESHDCWAVNHMHMRFNMKRTAIQEGYEYIRANNYVLPQVMVYSYHHFTGRSKKYLKFYQYFNPEYDGLEPPKDSNWHSTEWNPVRINAHPKKSKYVENKIQQQAKRHIILRKSF